MYKGRPTQHLVTKNDSGFMTVNKKQYGESKTIRTLVSSLSKKAPPAGWPVRLCEGVGPDGSVFAVPIKTGSVRKNSESDNSNNRNSTASIASTPEKDLSSKESDGTPWLHDTMSNEEANAKLSGRSDDGYFLVRNYNVSSKQYALTVVYKGKPTHHLVKAPDDSSSVVNGKSTDVVGIAATVRFLREKRPWWPVPLTDYVPSESISDGSQESTNEATTKSANETPDSQKDATRLERAPQPEIHTLEQVKAEDTSEIEKEAVRQQAEAAALKKEADEAERLKLMKEAAEREDAEDSKVTGFHTLANPFPEGEKSDSSGHAPTTATTSTDLLAQARALAIETAKGLSPDVRAKYNVGRLINLHSDGNEESSTDGPYDANPIDSSGSGLGRLATLERDIEVLKAKEDARESRMKELSTQASEAVQLRSEVSELRATSETLHRKVVLLEQILRATPQDQKETMTQLTEVRVLKRSIAGASGGVAQRYGAQSGGQMTSPVKSNGPTKQDLVNASLIGKIGLFRGGTYADARTMIKEDFDDEDVPEDYKFYTLSDDSDLLVIHKKQEAKITIDAMVVYIHKK